MTLCLVAAPTTFHARTVIRACIAAHVDYLDVQLSSKKLSALYAAEKEIKQAGLCFITEAGFHPGLPAAMIRYAASKFDAMEGFIDYQAQVYKHGVWTKPTSWDSRSFNFGNDIGKRTGYSMFFEELRDIPNLIPSIKDTGFYISGSNWFTDLIITPIVFVGLKLAPKRGLRPLGKLMWWGMGKSKPPYLVALKVEAKGQLNGRQAEVRLQIAHPDGYELTAIPVIAYLLQYLDGTAHRAGST